MLENLQERDYQMTLRKYQFLMEADKMETEIDSHDLTQKDIILTIFTEPQSQKVAVI